MRLSLLLAAVLMVLGLAPATAADAVIRHRSAIAASMTEYRVIPRSPVAQTVWASDVCWRGCAQDCGRQFKICLSQGESCVSQNNACDRACQRACRIYGGPLLPIDF